MSDWFGPQYGHVCLLLTTVSDFQSCGDFFFFVLEWQVAPADKAELDQLIISPLLNRPGPEEFWLLLLCVS